MIHLAFCSDKNYLPWCAVPAKTAIEKTSDCDQISIHFILSEDCKDTPCLTTLVQKLKSSRVSIHTYFVDESKYSDLPVSGHGSTANYFRLLIPELLPQEIDKLIYLDCDLKVLDSLAPLWDTNLRDAPLAAVSNMSLFESEATRLGVPYLDGTFNSGVLIMNLDSFRREGFHFKCMEKAKEMGGEIVYWDQDVLNILAAGRWLKLDSAWNVQHPYTLDPFIRDKYSVSAPRIIHFSGNGLKPWQSKILPYSDSYMKEFEAFGMPSQEPKSPVMAARKLKNKASSSLKRLVKKGVGKTLLNPKLVVALAPAYRPAISRAADMFSTKDKQEANQALNAKKNEIVSRHFSSLSVEAGPFRGMRYPAAEAVGSALLPKLAGSYEIEISKIFTPKFLACFTDFLDIGCAEGYYAVGAATIAPGLKVHAYDTNADARRLCSAMAELNNVSSRIRVDEKFSLARLAELKSAKSVGPCLVLVDCEGAEASIFSSESHKFLNLLADSTIIIESHEFIRPGIADHIIRFFDGSHRLERVLAVGDLLRSSFYSAYVPAGCDPETAAIILAENRPAPMEWLVFTPSQVEA